MDKKDLIIARQKKIIEDLIHQRVMEIMYYDTKDEIMQYEKDLLNQMYKEMEA